MPRLQPAHNLKWKHQYGTNEFKDKFKREADYSKRKQQEPHDWKNKNKR